MVNTKALVVFLLITFGLTLTAVISARAYGFTLFGAPQIWSQLVVLAAMFFPALGALITQKLVLNKPFKDLGLRWGGWTWYWHSYLIILVAFIINYAVVWAVISSPDFTLHSFLEHYGITEGLPLPAWQMIGIFTVVSLFVAPVVNLIPGLGEELGWRGFLLPQLEPLGRRTAAVVSSMTWALWHTPMIFILGFAYGREWWPGILLHFLLVTSIGLFMSYIWFKTRSTIQAGFIHAVFNAHSYGFWTLIFVSNDRTWVGAGSVISVVIWLVIGIWFWLKLPNKANH